MAPRKGIGLKFLLMPLATMLQFFLPRWLAIRAAIFFGNVGFRLMKKQRERICENLGHIWQHNATPQKIRNYARRTFVNYAIYITDLLRAPILTKKKLLSWVQFEGDENLRCALAKGKGVILCTVHIGNWDLAGVFLTRIGFKLVAAVEPIPEGVTEAFNRYRRVGGMEVIPFTATDSMTQALAKKKALVLLADRDLTGRGIELPCFDSKRSFPKGPAVLALRYKVPVLFGYFILSPQKGRLYRSVIEPEFNSFETGNFKQDVYNLTQMIAQRINQLISEYPDQWFVFQAEWQ
jgi:KDO2-lipid IV(A) lauroyltransferase